MAELSPEWKRSLFILCRPANRDTQGLGFSGCVVQNIQTLPARDDDITDKLGTLSADVLQTAAVGIEMRELLFN